jgi:hypothetical protein
MTPILSGSIIYEWTQEANDYGIIDYPDSAIQDGISVYVGVPIPLQPEFNNLKSAWAAASPTIVEAASYKPPTGTIACPAVTPGIWEIEGNASLPEKPGSLTPPKPSNYSFTGTLPSVTVNTEGITASSGGKSSTASAHTTGGGGSESGATASATSSPKGSSSAGMFLHGFFIDV